MSEKDFSVEALPNGRVQGGYHFRGTAPSYEQVKLLINSWLDENTAAGHGKFWLTGVGVFVLFPLNTKQFNTSAEWQQRGLQWVG